MSTTKLRWLAENRWFGKYNTDRLLCMLKLVVVVVVVVVVEIKEVEGEEEEEEVVVAEIMGTGEGQRCSGGGHGWSKE